MWNSPLDVNGFSKESFCSQFEVFKLEVTIRLNTISIGVKFSFYRCDQLFRLIFIKETTFSLKKKKLTLHHQMNSYEIVSGWGEGTHIHC